MKPKENGLGLTRAQLAYHRAAAYDCAHWLRERRVRRRKRRAASGERRASARATIVRDPTCRLCEIKRLI